MKSLAFAFGLVLTFSLPARAGDLRLEFNDGYVTLSARDVPVRQILTEWAARGRTRIINGEKVMGGPVSLELVRVPEKQAIEVILRSVAGYLVAARPVAMAGASAFDRIVVMPTSTAVPAAAAAAGARPGFPAQQFVPQQTPQPMVDDQDEPVPSAQPPGPEGFVPGPDANVPAPPNGPYVPAQVPGQPMQQADPAQNPNNTPPPPPGPTPLAPGVLTAPTPSQLQGSPTPNQQQQQQPPQ
jgi:hypothetical protein